MGQVMCVRHRQHQGSDKQSDGWVGEAGRCEWNAPWLVLALRPIGRCGVPDDGGLHSSRLKGGRQASSDSHV